MTDLDLEFGEVLIDRQFAPIGDLHDTFRRWLGNGYDTDALDVVLAVAAAERLTGDPVWCLLISGSFTAMIATSTSSRSVAL